MATVKGGRPSKYNWEAIQEAYEGGLDKDLIVKKYKCTKKLLNNKINVEKWEVKGHLKADIDEFYATTHKTAENVQKLHPDNQDIIVSMIDTMEQDNELISNNRKLAKMLQGVIVANRESINLQNIKNVSGVLKDIESIANPQASKIEVNNTNTQQTVNEIIISEA